MVVILHQSWVMNQKLDLDLRVAFNEQNEGSVNTIHLITNSIPESITR